MLEKTLESPLYCQEIKSVSPKGNQSWIFIARTDAEAEAPILWPLDGMSWLTEEDPDAGKDWKQEKKGKTEDELVGCHHRLDGHESEEAPEDSEGQGGLDRGRGGYSTRGGMWGLLKGDPAKRSEEQDERWGALEPGRDIYLMAQLRGKNVSWICRLPPGGDARALRDQAFVCQLPALWTGYVTVTTRQGLLGCARSDCFSTQFWKRFWASHFSPSQNKTQLMANFVETDLQSLLWGERALESDHRFEALCHWTGALCPTRVPNLWDLMPDDLSWSWCNSNRSKVHTKFDVLESLENWWLRWNLNLVPTKLGTTAVNL